MLPSINTYSVGTHTITETVTLEPATPERSWAFDPRVWLGLAATIVTGIALASHWWLGKHKVAQAAAMLEKTILPKSRHSLPLEQNGYSSYLFDFPPWDALTSLPTPMTPLVNRLTDGGIRVLSAYSREPHLLLVPTPRVVAKLPDRLVFKEEELSDLVGWSA